ncbi:ankyrin repeat-containing domain protein, partial [Tirmania nivea]
AAEKGDLEQVMAICTRHQNLLNAEDTGGYTPLYHASRCGHADVVNFLLSHGSLVDNQSRISGDTPLMGAVSHGHLEVVRLLLQRGADPKKRNSSGVDALECMDRYSP